MIAQRYTAEALSGRVGWRIGHPAIDFGFTPATTMLAEFHLWRKGAFLYFPINGRAAEAGTFQHGTHTQDFIGWDFMVHVGLQCEQERHKPRKRKQPLFTLQPSFLLRNVFPAMAGWRQGSSHMIDMLLARSNRCESSRSLGRAGTSPCSMSRPTSRTYSAVPITLPDSKRGADRRRSRLDIVQLLHHNFTW